MGVGCDFRAEEGVVTRVRMVIGLGMLAILGAGAVIVACGGTDATVCGAGTVRVGDSCEVPPADGTALDAPGSDSDFGMASAGSFAMCGSAADPVHLREERPSAPRKTARFPGRFV